ncbi:MAG: EamA family transporter [Pseudomonadota bacterium]|jgi:drug/metabolite transporter (DMT)-like permease|nr:EamA family transporter [Rubrivivax sp.]MCA3256813.1 EamA family transporter [Rubrivivax sp.]MCZ8029754.1 DMT family transporter [Rubrivivax sp.]
MPWPALALVLAAALLHALWNVAAKKSGGGPHFAFLSALMVSVLWAPIALVLAVDELPRWGLAQWLAVTASAFVHVLYFSALLRGYERADLTVVYPVARGSGPLLTAAGAVLLLGERPGPVAVLGVLAVCGGVFLIAGGPALFARGHDPRVRAGVKWGVITGTMIAGYSVIDGYAVKVLLVGPILLDWFGNLLRVPMLAPQAWRARASLRSAWAEQWRYALVVATLGPLAYIMVLYALKWAPLSAVAPAREVSMLFAALLGGRLLGEGHRGARVAGAVCIAGGVGALALG